MLASLRNQARKLLRYLVILTPWLLAMYLFFWLDSSGTWSSETPHRGKLSIVILATGMGLSFGVYTLLARRRSRPK